MAVSQLKKNRGPEEVPVIFLITDGRPDPGTEDEALKTAQAAKSEGIKIITVGYVHSTLILEWSFSYCFLLHLWPYEVFQTTKLVTSRVDYA